MQTPVVLVIGLIGVLAIFACLKIALGIRPLYVRASPKHHKEWLMLGFYYKHRVLAEFRTCLPRYLLPVFHYTHNGTFGLTCVGVGVVPISEDDRVVVGTHRVVKEYHADQARLEVGASGMIDCRQHTSEQQARAELLEECGLVPTDLQFHSRLTPFIGGLGCIAHMYIARGSDWSTIVLRSDCYQAMAWYSRAELVILDNVRKFSKEVALQVLK